MREILWVLIEDWQQNWLNLNSERGWNKHHHPEAGRAGRHSKASLSVPFQEIWEISKEMFTERSVQIQHLKHSSRAQSTVNDHAPSSCVISLAFNRSKWCVYAIFFFFMCALLHCSKDPGARDVIIGHTVCPVYGNGGALLHTCHQFSKICC